MENNIQDYPNQYWIIAFTVECTANFFVLFFSILIIIYSLKNPTNDDEKSKLNDISERNPSIIKPIDFTFHKKENEEDHVKKEESKKLKKVFQEDDIEENKKKNYNKINPKPISDENKKKQKQMNDSSDSIESEDHEKGNQNESDEESESEEIEEMEEDPEEKEKNDKIKKQKIDNLYEKYNDNFERVNTKEMNVVTESNFFTKQTFNESHKVESLEDQIKNYKFSLLDNSFNKCLLSIIVIIILLINAYVNAENYYNLRPRFQNTQYIIYNNTYVVNSKYFIIPNLNSSQMNLIYSNIGNFVKIKLLDDSRFDLNSCSKFDKNELKLVDLLYLINRGRYAFILLGTISDLIYLTFVFMSIYPNNIYRNIRNNSILASLLIYFIGNYTSVPVIGYYLFKIDEDNTCFKKYDYFEYFVYAYLIYGMYYTVFVLLNVIYFFLSKIYKLMFFVVFIFFPCSPICTICLKTVRNYIIKNLLISESLIREDILCYKKRFSSIILWLIILLGIVCCLFSFINFSILKYLEIINDDRSSFTSYISLSGLVMSFLTKIIVYCSFYSKYK